MIKTATFIILFFLTSCKGTFTSSKTEESQALADIMWSTLEKTPIDYDIDIIIKTLRQNHAKQRIPQFEPQMVLAKHIQKLNEIKARQTLAKANSYISGLNTHQTIVPGKLLYRVIKKGAGEEITEKASPLIHYKEIDFEGDVLFQTGEKPIRVPLEETISGFKQGVVGMRVGERREIVVHPDLAYKILGKTKPNQLLIYDVEILEK